MSGNAEELRSVITFTTETSEPGSSSSGDGRRHGDSLDVGDCRWASEQSDIGRERGLQTRFALLALDRLDQGRLLAADVCSGASVQVDVERVAGTAGVFTDETGFVRFVDGLLDVRGFLVELSSDVDVRWG